MMSHHEPYTLAVKAYASELYRYAYWLCRHRQLAEDLVQEALLRAWKHWQDLDDASAVKFWLFRIVRNEFLRQRSRNAQAPLESLDDHHLELPDAKLGLDDCHALRDLLMKTPASLREPLVLQVLGGFSSSEIATLLHTSETAINARLSRARAWCRALFFEPRDGKTSAEKHA